MKTIPKLLVLLILCVGQSHAANSIPKLKNHVLAQKKEIPGWCSDEKAQAMMDLVFSEQPQVCVEIGVFGGSSVFPTAMALRRLGNGVIYAIDPWKTEEAIKPSRVLILSMLNGGAV